MKIQRSTGDNGMKRECYSIKQGGTAGFRSLIGVEEGVPPFFDKVSGKALQAACQSRKHREKEKKMAEKKLVEAITSMSEDFAQWYTDVVKKAELIDYSNVK